MSLRFSSFGAAVAVAIVSSLAACSPADNGSSGSGGSASGGKANASGGQATGGASGGQSNGSGGSGNGGSSAKGGSSSSGGSATGGSSNGNGGSSSAKGGSSSSGGSATGGSGTAGSSSSDIPATFATVKLVFGGGGPIQPCASSPCHATGGMAPPGDNLELVDNEQLYMHLTTHVVKGCGNKKVVNPGNPNDSALVQILKGPCSNDTPRMPLGCTDATDSCIPPEYIDAVTRWIANGAPQN